MATIHVSKSTDNGYVVGNDANDGLTPATPKLTIEAAIAVVSCDRVLINDGVYIPATHISPPRSMRFDAVTPWAVTIRGVSGQARVCHTAISDQITYGKINLDANGNANQHCISTSTAVSPNLVFDGVRLMNTAAGYCGFYSTAAVVKLTILEAYLSGDMQGGGIVAGALGAGSFIACKKLVCENQDAPNGCTTNSRGAISLTATAAGAFQFIQGVEGVWKDNASGGAAIRSEGVRGEISYNPVCVTGTGTSAIIRVANGAVQADNGAVHHNTGRQLGAGPYLILIGSDAAGAADNKTNDWMVWANDVTGSDVAAVTHGCMMGNVTGGVMTGNTVTNAAIPYISKRQPRGALIFDNHVVDPVTDLSGCIRYKATTGGAAVCNRATLRAGRQNPLVYVSNDTESFVGSGTLVMNNALYSSAQVARAATVGGAGDSSTATLVGNNYLSEAGFAAGAFVSGASSYSDVAGWRAYETTARSEDPTTVDRAFWRASYRPLRDRAVAAMCPQVLPTF